MAIRKCVVCKIKFETQRADKTCCYAHHQLHAKALAKKNLERLKQRKASEAKKTKKTLRSLLRHLENADTMTELPSFKCDPDVGQTKHEYCLTCSPRLERLPELLKRDFGYYVWRNIETGEVIYTACFTEKYSRKPFMYDKDGRFFHEVYARIRIK